MSHNRYWELKFRIRESMSLVRRLGIPTVLDRLIQQALHQVLQPIFNENFSEGSYGFRPAAVLSRRCFKLANM